MTDRLFPVAKTLAKGMGQVGEGLSTIGELMPSIDLEPPASPLDLFPSGIVIDEDEYEQQREYEKQQEFNAQTRPRNEVERIPQVRNDPAPRCTTPSGGVGRCTDIQNCPVLLADLGTLRKSVSLERF